MTKAETAKQLFTEGYNCAQSIAGAFYEELGLPFDKAVKLSSPLGGGIGRMQEVCGAVNAIFLVLGAVSGYDDAKNPAAKAELYATVRKLADEFKSINKSIVCRELLKADGESKNFEECRRHTCAEKVYDAAAIIENYIKLNA